MNEISKTISDGQLCKVCQKKQAIVMHHINYNKQHKNEEIIPVCKSCHGEIHRDRKNKYYPINQPIVTTIGIRPETKEELQDLRMKLSKKYETVLSMTDLFDCLLKIANGEEINIKGKNNLVRIMIILFSFKGIGHN